MLGLIREKFNEAQLGAFRTSCFGHLLGVDVLAFSGQLIHELSLCRVANQEVTNLEGLTYLIFIKRGLLPYDIKVEPQRIRLLREYFPRKLGLVGESSKGMKEKGKGKAKAVPRKVTKNIQDLR
ncbi:hypothetical protein DVH24_023302 [Malus domestica]|uniref:Uncharacterized protein n=1 Tax=Malus domestica TaxID=3750 RepID=A0A498KPX0_MALDO|nr:hypothetical protein DVH24_023302 [Malus domestica]